MHYTVLILGIPILEIYITSALKGVLVIRNNTKVENHAVALSNIELLEIRDLYANTPNGIYQVVESSTRAWAADKVGNS